MGRGTANARSTKRETERDKQSLHVPAQSCATAPRTRLQKALLFCLPWPPHTATKILLVLVGMR